MPITGVHIYGEDVIGSELQAKGALLPFKAAEVERATAHGAKGRAEAASPYKATPPYIYRQSWDIEERFDSGNPKAQLFNSVPYARKLETMYHVLEQATSGIDEQFETAMNAAIDI